jgi:hypothetical protein
VDGLFARHRSGKVMVIDPQDDRAAALRQVQDAIRP